MPTIWLNGTFIDEADAAVSLRDAGLLHAAGVFTTMRAYGGTTFRLDAHLARLRQSCEALFVPLVFKDAELTAAVDELLRQNALAEARLRLTVTRGTASQDPLHGLRLEPNVFLTAAALEPYPAQYYETGMTVVLLDEQKLNPYDFQAGHKTLNYFSRLASLRAANLRGAGEALWFNVHNYLESGSVSNVFIVKAGELITPPTAEELRDPVVAAAVPYPKSTVLPGVTRRTVIELAKELGLNVALKAVNVNDVLAADEVFLTNSIMQVMPVCRIERKAVGDEKPGEITRRITAAYGRAVAQSA